MIADLFSQFDPRVSILFKYSPLLFWFSNFLIIFAVTLPSPFTSLSPVSRFFRARFNLLEKMSVEMRLGSLQGLGNILFSVFFLILMINLLGLLPGTFRVSSHFYFLYHWGCPFDLLFSL